MDVKVTTMNYGYEISWRLIDVNHPTSSVCGGSHYASHSVKNETCYVETGNYELRCEDSWGDGWNGGYLEIGGTKYCEDFDYNFPNDCGPNYSYGCNTLMPVNVTLNGKYFSSAIYISKQC